MTVVKPLAQADIRPKDLATRIDLPLEVVEICLKGKVPEAEVLYRMAKALVSKMQWLLTGEGLKLPKEKMECERGVRGRFRGY